MQSQTSNEENEERNDEIAKDFAKAFQFPATIIGRKRLRMLRFAFHKLGIYVPIPANSAAYTDEYCRKYSKEETNAFKDGIFI